ncbi:MAG: hypothetical protein HRT58_19805 [Crocinitomicaceae bacterium]|nr:hypothetical protein [Flavobacteriales bacterium]NQZ37916.1 hypothetical protein [Crocinitomicaceae bacterium]
MKNFPLFTAILLLFIGASNLSQAQTLREKLDAKLQAAAKKLNGEVDSSEISFPKASQLEIAAKWESGKYDFFKRDGRHMRKSGTAYIRILKDDEGKVTHVRLGKGSENERDYGKYNPYSYNGSEFVCAFVQNNNNVIYFTEDMIVLYACDYNYKVAHVYSSFKSQKKSYELVSEIQAYRDFGEGKIDSDRDALKEAEKIHRAEFTLEGKDVVKITPIYPDGTPKSIGSGERLAIGFEIKLADGSTMKTSNVGGEAYVEDLLEESTNASTSGIGSNYSAGMYGKNPETNAYLRTNISDYSKDYILVTVKSKFGGSASCEIKLPIDYNSRESYICSGGSGGDSRAYGGLGGDGGTGCTVTVKIKTTKHSETGEKLYYCQVAGQYYKVKVGGTFHVSASGGNGGSGGPGKDVNGNGGYAAPTDGGPAGDGGSGGNVTFHIDPSAKDIKTTYNVDGGNGGSGGIKGTCFSCSYGQDANHGPWGNGGSAGQGTKTIQAVNF